MTKVVAFERAELKQILVEELELDWALAEVSSPTMNSGVSATWAATG